MTKLTIATALACLFVTTGSLVLAASPLAASELYLDKLDKTLDNWWNALDEVCRGEPGDSEESNLACDQRLAVDKIIKKKGCRNIYPAPPPATSYWICKKK